MDASETPGGDTTRLRILIVAENVSMRLSGETLLPYHYLRRFLAEGQEVSVLCHERERDSLRRDLPVDWFARISFVADHPVQKALYRLGRRLPYRVEDLVVNQLIAMVTQWRLRGAARRLVARHRIDVAFQPTPIAPTAVSLLFGIGCPVVIGPMSGGMDLPPAFRGMDGIGTRAAVALARRGAAILHRALPAKRRAAALIVANPQTRAALPGGVRGRVHDLLESAVDLERWALRPAPLATPGEPVSFIFCGRFVDWKGIAFLVRAFAPLAREGGVRLDLVGDGELFDAVRRQIAEEGIADSVVLHGRLSIEEYAAMLKRADVYVTPALRECGGMAMMEAMAIGVPVIGVDWGGARLYAGRDAAILVDPRSEDALVTGLTEAMRRLAASPEERRRRALAGRRRLEALDLGWDAKARYVLAILSQAVADAGAPVADRHARPWSVEPVSVAIA
jgi:glycosyltransferase involved in cell wall biosynthesis